MLILSDEHGVVILLILIDQPRPYKGVEHLTVNEALFQQIGVQAAHLTASGRLDEFLFRFFFFGGRRFIDPALLTAQQTGDCFRIVKSEIVLHKGNGAAALFGGMIIPLVATNRDAVVAGHAVLRPGADELFSLTAQELHKVYRAGPEFLLLGKMNIGHLRSPLSVAYFRLLGDTEVECEEVLSLYGYLRNGNNYCALSIRGISLHADLFILMVIGSVPHGHFLFPNPLSELAVCERGRSGRPSRCLLLEYSAQVVKEPRGAGKYRQPVVHVVQEILRILVALRR